mgnify:CR=1 FL=1
MKKIISLLLALCMMLSLVTVVGAETIFEDIPFNGQGNSKTFLEYGKTVKVGHHNIKDDKLRHFGL